MQYGAFSGPYFPVRSKSLYSVQLQENTEQKKLRIWTLFTQWPVREKSSEWHTLVAVCKRYLRFLCPPHTCNFH